MKYIFLVLLFNVFILGCKEHPGSITAELTELSDAQYPDNPDLENRHDLYHKVNYSIIEFIQNLDSTFQIHILPKNDEDAIEIPSISFEEWIPVASDLVKGDEFLTYIALINQEWNRHQVRFDSSEFRTCKQNIHRIKRVDIARNCLNAYLWEIIIYADSENGLLPIHHSWFNFPKKFYASLFEKYNGLPYENYSKGLENWVTPENKAIELNNLRNLIDETDVKFQNLNNQPFPLTGERAKKYKNIIQPKATTIIKDFLTDETKFATFSPPGFYNTMNPRKTELSRFKNPIKATFRNIISKKGDTLSEIEIAYKHDIDSQKDIRFILSGLDLVLVPILDYSHLNEGWQNSMGFSNHTFYDTYKNDTKCPSKSSPYFCVLTNNEYKWLDSHEIGIDGPLLYWDKNESNLLHLWILSFERHCFVGHYTFVLDSNIVL